MAAIEPKMRGHVKDVRGDPVQMWERLKKACNITVTSSIFNIYQELFDYALPDGEKLTTIAASIVVPIAQIPGTQRICPTGDPCGLRQPSECKGSFGVQQQVGKSLLIELWI